MLLFRLYGLFESVAHDRDQHIYKYDLDKKGRTKEESVYHTSTRFGLFVLIELIFTNSELVNVLKGSKNPKFADVGHYGLLSG